MLITEDGEQDEILGIYKVLRALSIIRMHASRHQGRDAGRRVPSLLEHPARCFANPKTTHSLDPLFRVDPGEDYIRVVKRQAIEADSPDMHQALKRSTVKTVSVCRVCNAARMGSGCGWALSHFRAEPTEASWLLPH